MNSIPPHLFIGTFDAEKYWRDSGYAALPSIKNIQSEYIISTLDELQFVFCSHEADILFTRYKIEEIQYSYLREIGFRFTNKFFYSTEDTVNPSTDNICNLLTKTSDVVNESDFKNVLFCPYAIDKFTIPFCEKYNILANLPHSSIVQKVNSKFFSYHLTKNYFPNYKGKLAKSADTLLMQGEKMLQESKAILIKDAFGVSGKGNIKVESVAILKNIYSYLKKQENLGRLVQFILEPFMEKKVDFSCQLELSSDGNFQYRSIQVMQNKGFSFLGIKEADKSFYHFLYDKGYYDIVGQIANSIHKQGYFGTVCIDSMLLADNNIFPLLEINARKSMGTINVYLKKYLNNEINMLLMSYSVGIPDTVNYIQFIDRLKTEGILYTPSKGFGVIPLSSRAFSINKKRTTEQRYHGRIYVEYIYENDHMMATLEIKLEKLFSSLGIIKY